MKHFNQLTPAEAERLALLAEEMAETIQVIGKILRHGYESENPFTHEINRDLLNSELGDVSAAIAMMVNARDISYFDIERAETDKLDRVKEYLHHQEASDEPK